MPDLLAKLGPTEDGLTEVEAAKRLTQYGPNEIPVTRNPGEAVFSGSIARRARGTLSWHDRPR
jgi:hypothetical protein